MKFVTWIKKEGRYYNGIPTKPHLVAGSAPGYTYTACKLYAGISFHVTESAEAPPDLCKRCWHFIKTNGAE